MAYPHHTPATQRARGVLFRFLWACVLAFGLTLAGAAGAPGSAQTPSVKSVRLGENAERTRFVLDIDRAVDYTHFLLADPHRVVVDLPEVEWALDGAGAGEGRGLIESYRYGLFHPGNSRLVLDLGAPAVIERIFMLEPQSGYPYRLVIDLRPAGDAEFASAVEAGSAAARSASRQARQRTTPERVAGRRTVVVDPGHGGVDPGAISVIGVPEKKIALETARAIRDALQGTGSYRVLLTRDSDVYVPHAQRVSFSRQAGADLFISVHADSIRDPRIRGATVYTLSEKASDREAAALARKENKSDIIAGVNLGGESPEVANILLDLAMRETMNYSARFAGYLLPELKKRVVLRQNSHRFAGFLVLKAPDVPSVLLEIGYLSNREDARAMTSASGRADIAEAVSAAVDSYFTSVVAASGY